MKTKFLLALIACTVIVIVLFLVSSAYHAAAGITWHNKTAAGVKYLAEGIERYRNEHDAYPSSLEELFAGSDPEWTNYMHRFVFKDQFDDKYEYQLFTNEFVVRVTRPTKWFLNGETLEKKYDVGKTSK